MTMKRAPRIVAAAVAVAALAAVAAGCRHADDKRIPWANVRISFATMAEWEVYGVPGAMDYRYFIKPTVPSNYPYTSLTYTGFGGILLVADIHGVPLAYDLACPVEATYDVRVAVDDESNLAECSSCHSTYDVFVNYGAPISGPAADKGFSLTRYKVGAGPAGEYRYVSN